MLADQYDELNAQRRQRTRVLLQSDHGPREFCVHQYRRSLLLGSGHFGVQRRIGSHAEPDGKSSNAFSSSGSVNRTIFGSCRYAKEHILVDCLRDLDSRLAEMATAESTLSMIDFKTFSQSRTSPNVRT